MTRKTFDSTKYHRAKDAFDGHCLGCGAWIGIPTKLINIKGNPACTHRGISWKGTTSKIPHMRGRPNKMLCCNGHCEKEFIKNSIQDWSKVRSAALLRDDHTCKDCHKQYKIKFIRCYRPDYLPTLTEIERNPLLAKHKTEIGGHRFVWMLVKEQIPMEVHHIIPISEGGPEFALDNLITLCEKCHDKRHAGKPRPTKEEITSIRIYNNRKIHISLDRFAEASQ